jgi:hypothetical protein
MFEANPRANKRLPRNLEVYETRAANRPDRVKTAAFAAMKAVEVEVWRVAVLQLRNEGGLTP